MKLSLFIVLTGLLSVKALAITINGPTVVDENQSVTYSISGNILSSDWSTSGGIITSQTNNQITVYWTSSGSKTVSVFGQGAKGSFSGSLGVTVNPGCQAVVAGSLSTGSICPGDVISLTGYSGGDNSYTFQWKRNLYAGSSTFTSISGANSASYTPSNAYLSAGYDLKVRVTSCSQNVSTAPVTLSYTPGSPAVTAGTVTGGDQTFCEGNPIPTLSYSGTTGGTGTFEFQWQWADNYPGAAWTNVVGATQSNYTPATVTDYKFRMKVTSCGQEGYSNEQFLTEIESPASSTTGTLSANLTGEICPYIDITFTHTPNADVPGTQCMLQGDYNGEWKNRGTFAADNMLTVMARPNEKFRVIFENQCVSLASNAEVTFTYKDGCNQPSSLNKNFVRTEVPKVEISDEYELSEAGPSEKSMTYAYQDGLGRPLQSVAVAAGKDNADIYSFNVYESNGREEKSYLPLVVEGGANGKFQEDIVTQATTLYQEEYDDNYPYSQTFYENASSGKVESTLGVGEEWHTNDKRQTFDSYWNDGSEGILKWGIMDNTPNPDEDEGDKPTVLGSYDQPNTLRFRESTNEEGIKTRVATDLRGRQVVSQIFYENDWISSYTVYDDFERVRYMIPPEAAIYAETNNSLTDEQIDGFLFQTCYDRFGRTIKSKSPGAGWNYVVFDEWGRVVLTQDAAQRAKGNYWSFVKYDDWNREIMTGEKSFSNGTSHEDLIDDLEEGNNTEGRYESVTTTGLGYTLNNTYPDINEGMVLTVHYYDNYNFLTPDWDDEGHDYSYLPPSGFNMPASFDDTIIGEATGSKVRILTNSGENNPDDHSNNQWLNTVLFLDDKGRIVQTVGENHLGGVDRISNELNWQGQLTRMKVEHSVAPLGGAMETLDITTTNVYDETGALVETYQQFDAEPPVLVAQYVYNQFGELEEKKLRSDDGGTTFLQSLDYDYTIRGWLDQINNAALSDDGTDGAAQPDLFGAKYHYTAGTAVNVPGRYDGNMAGMEYAAKNDPASSFADEEGAVGFTYDEQNRLISTTTDNSAFDMAATYDNNGNIQTMSRKSEGTEVDDLTYNYDTDSNKLLDVEDATDDQEGFNNRHDGSSVTMPGLEYEYDEAGNMTEDQNKGIMAIGYNKFQRVDYIEFSDMTRIQNLYDASGNRLAKIILDANDNEIARVDYIGAIEYLNYEINQVMTDEGRAYRQGPSSGGDWFFEYFIRDHQMNNRLAFGVLPYRKIHLATMETERIPLETTPDDEGYAFAINANTRSTAQNHTPLGDESAALNALAGRMLGPALSLEVKSGDHLDMEAWAKYTDFNWDATAASGLAGALTDALGLSGSNGTTEKIYNAVNSLLGGAGAAGVFSESAMTNEPDAFLQYLFFDTDSVFQQAGFVGVSLAAYNKFEKLTLDGGFDAPMDGFIYIYVANETSKNQEVYFDDLKVTHESATANFKVSQINDYYPFGMITSKSWRNNAYIDPGLLYQSSYAAYDSLTGYYDFLSRNYDPQLGRFFAMDPANQFGSPYMAMGNVPHMTVDPTGEEAFLTVLAIGAVVGGVSFTASTLISGGHWDRGQFGKSMARGAASAAMGNIVGDAFGGAGNFWHEGHRALAHGQSQLFVGAMFGEMPTSGGFLSTMAGSLVSSGITGVGGNDFAQSLGSATLAGGISHWSGGDFWQGFSTSAIVSLTNHAMHRFLAGGNFEFHEIKKGETLYSISQKYGMTVEELRELNGMMAEETHIEAGATILVRITRLEVTPKKTKKPTPRYEPKGYLPDDYEFKIYNPSEAYQEYQLDYANTMGDTYAFNRKYYAFGKVIGDLIGGLRSAFNNELNRIFGPPKPATLKYKSVQNRNLKYIMDQHMNPGKPGINK